jgi:hypothetical protein
VKRPGPLPIVLALGAALPLAAHGAEGTPPPRWERLAEIVTPTIEEVESLRDGGAAGLPERRVLARCAERVRTAIAACARGRRPAALGCAARLMGTALALDEAVDQSTPAGALTAFVATDMARLAVLVATLERVRDECTHPPSGGSVPAVLAWHAGGTRLEVEPALPLAPGTRYRLVIEPRLAVSSIRPALDRHGRLLGEPAPAAKLPALVEYGTRMLREAADVPGVTTRPVLTLRLARPVPIDALPRLRVAFHEIAPDDGGDGIVVATVGEDLLPAPPRPAPAPQEPPRLIERDERATLGLESPELAGVVLRLGSFVVRATGSARRVPYVVARPRTPADSGRVVLLLHGLGGSAARFLRIRGASLLAEGATLVAMDLPRHGMRDDGTPFLDTRDPTVLSGNLRTAVEDVVALAAHLRTQGAIEPDAPPVTAVRVLAYSIGATVASVALAVDPTLGAAVLMAPPGDLADFLGVSTSASFGEPLLRCLVGGELGAPCGAKATCPGGTCALNPLLLPPRDVRTAVRTIFAAVDPQTRARAMAGADGTRPILFQVGGQDGIVEPDQTVWLAAALGADLTCTRRTARPQTLCRFPDAGHNVGSYGDARRQGDAFVLSDGALLAPSGAAWRAR